jgi:hypothetical protein
MQVKCRILRDTTCPRLSLCCPSCPSPKAELSIEDCPLTTYEPCPACQDAGGITAECPICGGEGYLEETTSTNALVELDDEEYPRT